MKDEHWNTFDSIRGSFERGTFKTRHSVGSITFGGGDGTGGCCCAAVAAASAAAESFAEAFLGERAALEVLEDAPPGDGAVAK